MKRISLIVALAVGVASCGDDTGSNKDGGPDVAADADAQPANDVAADLPSQPDMVIGPFAIGGTVAGLVGTGLLLENAGGDDLAVAAGATTFSFATPLATGSPYGVTIVQQPTAPAQTCTVTAGSGIVATTDVVTVAIVCTTQTFTIGGTITGSTGSGLVLRNNAGDDLSVPAGAGSFTFPTAVAAGAPYAVTVLTQPAMPSEICTVSAGAGTVESTNITDVRVTCVPRMLTVGGTITGLLGSGLVLQNNAGDNVTVAPGATTFTFATPVASGGAYRVTVFLQPSSPAQTCTVTPGTAAGTVGAASVTSVAIACSTKTFTVGGTIIGLTGSGMVLQSGTEKLTVPPAATSFTFPTPLPSNSPFAVTLLTQPTTPAQTCSVAGGSGVIGSNNVASVVVNCVADKFVVGGQITGLHSPVVLRNGTDTQTVSADGIFAFPTPIATGEAYTVAVATQPSNPSQTCTVANGAGTMAGAPVSNVLVTCTTNLFRVRAAVTGLAAGSGLTLRAQGDDLLITAPGTFLFPAAVASGSSYLVSVIRQPTSPSQTCTVAGPASGVVGEVDVVVSVVCTTNLYKIQVTVAGLAGTGLILHSGADDVPVTTSGTFNLPTAVPSGSSYIVTVAQQPTAPSQTCTVSPAMPSVVGSADGRVTVSCVTRSFKVTGTITGLVGTGLVLQNNGGNNTPVAAGATMFEFTTPVLSGAMYNVTVGTQPSGPIQTCVPSAKTGPVADRDITTVVITCTTNLYSVNVTVTNLAGTGLVLQNKGADDLAITGNMTVPFATKLSSDQTYAVTVLTPPSNPSQVCTVTPPSGPVGGANVSVSVDCATPVFAIGGKIYGLVNTGLVLHDTTPEDLSIAPNSTAFAFGTKVPGGSTYAVSLSTVPANQSCQVTDGTGPVTNADISSVVVDCAICAEVPEHGTISIACPPGQTIASFDFASYGTPTGTCGAFVTGSCNASTSSTVFAPCVGKSTCEVDAENFVFGDPCSGTFKNLAVQARCR